MNRRTYLKTVGGAASVVGLAGCASSKQKPPSDPETSVFDQSNAFRGFEYLDGTLTVLLDKFPYIRWDWQPVTKVTVADDTGEVVLGPREFTYGDLTYEFDLPNTTDTYRALCVFDGAEGDWEGKGNAVEEVRFEVSDGGVRTLGRELYLVET